MFSTAIREFMASPAETRRLGPYRCKDLLDKAGTAPVFKAVEEHAGHSIREVAVKVFDIGRSATSSPAIAPSAATNNVVDEARSLCRVQHPNVIRFHTLSTDPKRGLMGLVMEFAEGISADRQIDGLAADDHTQRLALAVEIGINISAALTAAHEADVVHCNVKPSNIMFTDGTYKLINFGIAATLGGEKSKKATKRTNLTIEKANIKIGERASTLAKEEDASIPGSIGYVDPVCVATTAAPTASSDLYSLGATLYQCITGQVPIGKDGQSPDGEKLLRGESTPTPLAELAPNTPADLAKLIDTLVSPSRESRPRTAEAVHRSLERIRSALLGRERALPSDDRGPFPGLDRYEASDRDVFFGRSAEIAGVIELCRTRGLVGIVGLSGSGKSSLTRAGVVPAIEEGALGGWPKKYRSVLVTPGSDLMGALNDALSKTLGSEISDQHPEAIAEQLSQDVDAKGEGIVILVDQLEEILIKHDPKKDKGRRLALDLLTRLAEAHVGVRVIVAVRRDLLDGVLAIDPHFSRALSRGIQLLGPLSSAAWEEVLDESLEAFGYSFEDANSLRAKVLANLKERESAMTLAQFGLTRLWAGRNEKKKTIPASAFSGKDGMQGALEGHADSAIAGLSLPREKLRDVLLAMTTPEGTRAHIELDTLVAQHGKEAKDVVFALTKARLVVSEQPGFTFVHDSVLREWSLVRRWLEDARDDRLLVAHLDRDAARWSKSEKKDAAELWRKGRLAAALELWKLGTVPLNDDARAFLTAGASEERKTQLARWSIVVVVVAIIVGGSLLYAKQSRDAAARARTDADNLNTALKEVSRLKAETEENEQEAAATAKLLDDLQKQMAEERATYGKKVQATLQRVSSATSLDGAQKASDELKLAGGGPVANPVVPLPLDVKGISGPSTGLNPGGPSPSVGGGTFDQGAIERVVNSRKAGVKRTCLERSANTAGSTKVTATLTIAPNGSVQNVTSQGDNPVVARCIEQQLRSWSFPPPGETKTVQIPFVFIKQ
jgi:eukaryotic-like serine/threonine-protein kinase